ncbi:MAG: transposase [Candidatus Acidiferrum sp.]
MRRYRLGSPAKHDLKVRQVWVPKYRKRVLTGPGAVHLRDLLRQIAMENDLQIISGVFQIHGVNQACGEVTRKRPMASPLG